MRKPKNDVPSNGDEAVPARYLYRPANAQQLSFWDVLAPGAAPLNTRAGHDRLIGEWNEGDKGKWVWRWEEVLRCDFDYPSFLAPELGAEHIALCIWLCLGKEDGGIPLIQWLTTLPGRLQAVHIPDGKARALGKAGGMLDKGISKEERPQSDGACPSAHHA